MNIQLPYFISKDDKMYRLHVTFRSNHQDIWEWCITYVGDTGIAFICTREHWPDAQREVLEMIASNEYTTH